MRGGSADLREAVEAARNIAGKAYSPYSNFRVGAAILTKGGHLYTGCNVENASYGLSVCAERNAAAAMVANAESPEDREIELVAIASPDAAPCFPCGACRQVLREFGCEEIVVEDSSDIRRYAFSEMLPNSFGPEVL